MKLKSILLLFIILSSPLGIIANPINEALKKCFTQAQTYVQQNKGTIAQTTAGILTFGAGSTLTVLTAHAIYTKPQDRFIGFIIGCFTVPAAYCGYHTLNDALNNKPNDLLKNLVQKAKAQLPK